MARNLDANALFAHGRFLRALARDLLGDEHLAEDVVQETWIRAWQSGPAEEGSLRAWLAAVTRNLARDRGRSERARRQRERKVARPEAAPHAARFEEQQRVAAMVLELDAPYRDVLVLRYVDGLTPHAIAQQLGIPAATVRTRIHRALRMLRARLDARHDGRRGAWSALLLPLLDRPRLSPLLAGGLLVSKAKYVAVVLLLLALWGVSELPAKRADRAVVERETVESVPPAAVTPAVAVESFRRVLAGRVIGTDGTPVPDALVAVYRHFPARNWIEGAPPGRKLAQATCDSSGAFALELDSEDAALLRASHASGSGQVAIPAGRRDRRAIEIELQPTFEARLRVVDPENRPVEGAEVNIGTRLFSADGAPTRRAVTDADGIAACDGIPADPYGHGVTVRHPDFVMAAAVGVVLPAADWTVRLVRGTTWSGRIVDAAHAPVPGACIRWVCTNELYGSGEATADASGRFVIGALPPYPCVAFIDGGAQGHAFRELAGPPHPPEIALDAVRERFGTVRTEAGERVPGVRIVALSEEDFRLRTSFSNGITVIHFPRLLRFATTDEHGQFRFPGLSEGAGRTGVSAFEPYRTVRAEVEGDAVNLVVAPVDPLRVRVVDETGNGVAGARVVQPGGLDYERFTDGEGRCEFTRRSASELRVRKRGFAPQRAKLVDDEPVLRLRRVGAVRGRVVDAQGRGVGVARLEVGREYSFTDADGWFRLWIEPGTPRLTVDRDGFEERTVTIEATGHDREIDPIELAPHAGASLRGTVTDPRGVPVANAVVKVEQKGRWRGDRETRTDVFGRYSFPLLNEGRARITVDAEGYAPHRGDAVELAGAHEVPITLSYGARIAGVVIGPDGVPAGGVAVEVTSGEERRRGRSDERGRFEFETLPAGPCELAAVVVVDEVCRTWAKQLVDAGDGNVVVRLAPPTWIGGRLVDRGGEPVAGVGVSVSIEGVPMGHDIRRDGVTDDAGRFRFDGLAGGVARVRFATGSLPEGATRALPSFAGVPTGEDRTFRLLGEGSITGVVLGPDGRAAGEARVYLQDGDAHCAAVTTDARGRFRIDALDPERRYTLNAMAQFVPQGGGVSKPAWTKLERDVPVGNIEVRLVAGP